MRPVHPRLSLSKLWRTLGVVAAAGWLAGGRSAAQTQTFDTHYTATDVSQFSTQPANIVDFSKFYGTSWNVSSGDIGGFTTGVFGEKYGAQFSAQTNGQIGFDVSFKMDSGSMNVDLPNKVSVTPSGTSGTASTLTITQDRSTIANRNYFETTFPTVTMGLDAQLKIDASVTGKVAYGFGETSGTVNLRDLVALSGGVANPALVLGTNPFINQINLLSYNPTDASHPHGDGTLKILELPAKNLVGTEGLTVPISSSMGSLSDGTKSANFQTTLGTVTINPPHLDVDSGQALTKTGSQPIVLSVGLDVPGVISTALGLPFNPLEIRYQVPGTPLELGATLLSADANLALGLKQTVTLSPNTFLGLQSSKPVTYNWTNAQGVAMQTTTTDLLLPLNNDGSVNHLSIASMPINDPDFQLFSRIEVRPQVTNTLYLTATGFLDLTGGSFSLGAKGIGGGTPNLIDQHIDFTSTPLATFQLTSNTFALPDGLVQVLRSPVPLFGVATRSFSLGPGEVYTFDSQSGSFSAPSIGGQLGLNNSLFSNDKDVALSGSITLGGNSTFSAPSLTPASGAAVTIQEGSSVNLTGSMDSSGNFIFDPSGNKTVGFVDSTGLIANGAFNLQGSINYSGPGITRLGPGARVMLINAANDTVPRFNNNGFDGLRTLARIDGSLALAGTDLTLGQTLVNAGQLAVAGGATLTINGDFTNLAGGVVGVGNASALNASGAFTNVSSGTLANIDLTLGASTGGTLSYAGGGITNLASTTTLTLSGTRPVASSYLKAGTADALAGLASNAGTLVLQRGATQAVGGDFASTNILNITDANSALTIAGGFTATKTTLAGGGALNVGGSLGNFTSIGGLNTLMGADWALGGKLTYNGATIQSVGVTSQLAIDGAGNGPVRTGGANAFTDLSRVEGSLTLKNDATLTTQSALAVSGHLTLDGASATLTAGGLSSATGKIDVLAGTLDTTGGAGNASYWSSHPGLSSLPLDANNYLTLGQPMTLNGTLISAGSAVAGIAAGTSITVKSAAPVPFKTLGGDNALAALTQIDGTLETGAVVEASGAIDPGASLRTDASLNVSSTGTLTIGSNSTVRVAGETFALDPSAHSTFAGTLALGGGSYSTSFTVPAGYNFDDGGVILLGTPARFNASTATEYYQNAFSAQLVAAPGTLWRNTNQTIIGAGEIAGGTLDNQGTIQAAGQLTLHGFDGPILNSGLLTSVGTAANPSRLELNGVTLQNTHGTLSAGSVIALSDTSVAGGRIFVPKDGTFESYHSDITVDTLRIDGLFKVLAGAQSTITAPTTVTATGSLVLDHDVSTPATLAFGPNSSLVNQGLISLAGGTQITGLTIQNQGRITLAAGTVNLDNVANTTSGTIELPNSAVLQLATASFNNAGLIHLAADNPTVAANASATFLVAGDLTLTGGGVVQLGGYNTATTATNAQGVASTGTQTTWTNAGSGAVRSDNGDHVLTLTDQTIRGQGELGQGTLSIDNQAGGAIATADGGTLTINTNSGGFRNRGRLDVGLDSTMNIAGGPFLSLADGALSEGSYRVAGTLKIPGLGASFDTAVPVLFDGANPKIVRADDASNAPVTLRSILPTGSFTRLNGTTTFSSTATDPFSNQGLLGAGNGDIDVATPGNITITGGYFSNYANNTLTGGRYDVTGTFKFEGADILTNAADITLRAGGQILDGTGQDGLRGFTLNSGSFRLFTGENYTTGTNTAAFTNTGLLQLDRSTMTAGSNLHAFASSGTFDMDYSVFRFGGTGGTFSNSGSLDLNHSTIEVLTGAAGVTNTGSIVIHDGSNFSVQSGVATFAQNGTVRIGSGAWLDFGSASVNNAGANYYIQGRILGGTGFGGGATRLTLYGPDAQWQVNGLPSPRINTAGGMLTFAGGYTGNYLLNPYDQRPINVGTWEIGSSHALAPDGSTIRSAGSAVFTGTAATDDIYFDNTATLRYYGGATDDGTFGQFKIDKAHLIIDGGLTSDGKFDASGTVTFVNGGSLELRGTLANSEGALTFAGGGSIIIDGGLDLNHPISFGGSSVQFIPAPGRALKLDGVIFEAAGFDLGTTNTTPIALRNHSQLTNLTTGKSALANLTLNAGTIALDDSLDLQFAGAFTNNGTMTVANSSFLTFGASLTNNGTMTGDRFSADGDFRVATNLINNGTLGGRVTVGGNLTNGSTGVLDNAIGTVTGGFSNSGTISGNWGFAVGTSVSNHGVLAVAPNSFTKIGGGALSFFNDGTLTLNNGTYDVYAFSGTGGSFAVAANATVTLPAGNPGVKQALWSTGANSSLAVASDAVFGDAPDAISASIYAIKLGANSQFSFSGPLAATRVVQTAAGASIFGATGDAAIPGGVLAQGDLRVSGNLSLMFLSFPSTAALDVGGHLTLLAGGIFKTITGSGDISYPANKNLEVQNGSSFSGTIHNPAGGGLFVSGATFAADVDNLGDMTFKGGTLTYDGHITGAGTLRLLNNTSLTLTRSNTVGGGATIDAGSSLTFAEVGTLSGNIINNGNVTYAFDAVNFTVPSNVTGTGTLTQAGRGSFVTIPNLGIGGGLNISYADSAVIFGTGGALSGTLSAPIANNGLLWFNQTGNVNVTGDISGSGSVEQVGAGTLTLSNPKTYSGKTLVGSDAIPAQGNTSGGGTLSISSDASLGTAPATFVADQLSLGTGTTLNLLGSTTLAATRGLTTQGAVTITGASLTAPTGIGGAGPVNYAGTGTLTVGLKSNVANHDFAVGSLGALAFDNLGANADFSSALSGGSSNLVRFQGAGATRILGTSTFAGQVEVAAGSTLQFGESLANGTLSATTNVLGTLEFNRNTDVTVSGFTGTGTIVKSSVNTLTITQPATDTTAFRGSVVLRGGVLAMSDYAALGLAPAAFRADGLTFDGGTLRITGGSGGVGSNQGVTVTANNGTIDLPGSANFDLAGPIAGTGTLTKTGTGSLSLSGGGLFTSALKVTEGTLRSTSNTDTTFSGTLSDNVNSLLFPDQPAHGAFWVDHAGGLGNVTFTGDNTYTGGTKVSGGVDLILGNGGTTGSVLGAIDVSLLSNVRFNRSDDVVLSNTVTGAGGLVQAGPGKLTINSAQAYTGPTKVTGGTLRLTDGAAFAGSLVDNAALELDYATNQSFDAVISGTGAVMKRGATTTTLTAANTYTGATNVNAGTLVLTGANTGAGGGAIASGAALRLADGAGSIGGTFANNGTLELARTGNYSVPLGTTGTGTIVKTNSGDAYLTGATNSANNLSILGGGLGFDLSGTGILSGAITGPGTLLKKGSGTLVIGGNNDTASGASILAGTLQIGNGASTGTLAGAIVVADGATLAYNRSTPLGISDSFSGAGAFAQLGTGALTILGNFTHTGGTTIGPGATLRIGSNGSVGALAGNVTNNGTLVFNRSDDTTFAGNTSGNGTLVQAAASTLTLTGAHTATGGATINPNATLALATTATFTGPIANSGNLSIPTVPATTRDLAVSVSGSGVLTVTGGGTLRVTGEVTYSGETHLVDTSALQLVNTSTSTLSNRITGDGSLEKLGAGTLILTADNTFTGVTKISAGVLQLGDGGTTGAIGAGTTPGNLDLAGGALAIDRANAITLANVISGSGGLTQLGSGGLTLGAANTYLGTTTVGAGSTINLAAAGSIAGPLKVDGSFLVSNTGDYTFNSGQTIGGAGLLQKTSAGDLHLNGPLAFTGQVTTAGTLYVAGSGTIGTFSATALRNLSTGLTLLGNTTGTVVNVGILSLGTGGTTGSVTSIDNQGTLIVNRSDSYSVAGVTGTGYFVQAGTGTTTVSGGEAGSYSATGGRLVFSRPMNGLISDAAIVRLKGGEYANAISGAGILETDGLVTLSGTNTLTGTVAVVSGTLTPGNTLGIATGANLSVAGGATYDLGGFDTTYAGLAGAGTVALGLKDLTVNASANTTFTGMLTGSGNVRKQGAGALTLAGADARTGGVLSIEAGKVAVGANEALATNRKVTLANVAGALLDLVTFHTHIGDLDGGGGLGGALALGTGWLTIDETDDTDFAGAISGSGGLTKEGTGTLRLTGTSAYSGATQIHDGTLALGSIGALGSSGVMLGGGSGAPTLELMANTIFGSANPLQIVGSGGALRVDANTVTQFNTGFSGSGNLTKAGAGDLQLNAANGFSGFSGMLNVADGRLVLGRADAVNSSQLLFTNAGRLNLNGANWTSPLTLNSGGGVTNSAANAVTVSGQVNTDGNFTLGSVGGDLRLTGNINSTAATASLTVEGSGRVSLAATPAHGVGTLGVTGTLAVEDSTTLTALTSVSLDGTGRLELGGTGATRNLSLTSLNFNAFQPVSGDGATLINPTAGTTVQVTAGNVTFNSFAGVALLGGNGNLNLTATGMFLGPQNVAKVGTGATTLVDAGDPSLWSGAIDVRAGTLVASNALLTQRDATIAAGGTLQVVGGNVNFSSLTGGGTLALGTNNLTVSASGPSSFGGLISGSGRVTKSGTGSATFGSLAVGTFTATDGETTINGSTGATTVVLDSLTGGVLHLNAAAVTANGGTTFVADVDTNSLVTLLNQTRDVTTNAGSITIHPGGNINDDSSTNHYGVVSSLTSNTGTVRVLDGASVGVANSFTNTGTVTIAANSGLSFATPGTSSSLTQGGGTLTLDSNGSITVRTINVTGGAMHLNGQVLNFSGSPTLTLSGGTLTGSGQILGRLTLNGGVFSPGNSPGQMSVNASTWNGGGEFRFELNALPTEGVAGANWDLLSIANTLTINATSTNKFTIDLVSLAPDNTPGLLANFDASQNYAWNFVTAGGLSGFDPAQFAVTTGGFGNAVHGLFRVTANGSSLDLVYTYDPNFVPGSAVPEPSAYAALTGALALGYTFWRRRQRDRLRQK